MMEGVTYFGETWDFFDLALIKSMYAINDHQKTRATFHIKPQPQPAASGAGTTFNNDIL